MTTPQAQLGILAGLNLGHSVPNTGNGQFGQGGFVFTTIQTQGF
jgi:hypothetical protein